jgi:cytoskeletal protein CcmA (bactofilin family)
MWKKEKSEAGGSSWDDVSEDEANTQASGGGEGVQGVNAFVGKGVEFKGVISYNGTVRIDGHMEGEIHTEGTLLIGEEAIVSATVSAGTIICKGKITGDITAKEKVRLRTPACLSGSVTTPMLSMEEGVLFNGNCEMNRAAGRDHAEKVLHPVAAQGNNLKRSTA